jgi:hypothetical protein
MVKSIRNENPQKFRKYEMEKNTNKDKIKYIRVYIRVYIGGRGRGQKESKIFI